MRGISWLAANQLASQEGLCTMEEVRKEVFLDPTKTINLLFFNSLLKGLTFSQFENFLT